MTAAKWDRPRTKVKLTTSLRELPPYVSGHVVGELRLCGR